MVCLKQEVYTFTPEEIDLLTQNIVKEYSRKKFTEDDLKRMVDNNGERRKKINRSKTGFHIYMDELREKNIGEKQSELFKQGGNNWNEMSETIKQEYFKKAEELKNEKNEKNISERKEKKEEEEEGYEKMYLECKKNNKIWMYKVKDSFTLEMKQGIIGNDLKKDSKSFNDEDQLNCYLNKQIHLKRKKGYESK